ncbi:hypothetical protein PGB90_009208 [Kerria lacca]
MMHILASLSLFLIAETWKLICVRTQSENILINKNGSFFMLNSFIRSILVQT